MPDLYLCLSYRLRMNQTLLWCYSNLTKKKVLVRLSCKNKSEVLLKTKDKIRQYLRQMNNYETWAQQGKYCQLMTWAASVWKLQSINQQVIYGGCECAMWYGNCDFKKIWVHLPLAMILRCWKVWGWWMDCHFFGMGHFVIISSTCWCRPAELNLRYCKMSWPTSSYFFIFW